MLTGWVKIGDFRQITDYISKTVGLQASRGPAAIANLFVSPIFDAGTEKKSAYLNDVLFFFIHYKEELILELQ